METTELSDTIYRLAVVGEEAGFSLEDMIQLLNAGITVGTLLNLIEWRLWQTEPHTPSSSRWVM